MSKPVTSDLFSFSGRRNRRSYLLALLLWAGAMIVVWGIALAIAAATDEYTMLFIAGLLSVPAVISGWALGSQRCRDFGWTGWAMLITLIPYIGWIFSLAIIFIPGTLGPNRYGPDPLGPSMDAGAPQVTAA